LAIPVEDITLWLKIIYGPPPILEKLETYFGTAGVLGFGALPFDSLRLSRFPIMPPNGLIDADTKPCDLELFSVACRSASHHQQFSIIALP
jgi:hypothetical protein